MTEGKWLRCDDPELLIRFVRGYVNGKASDRKLRLFAVACCRRIWDFLPSSARAAIELAERVAEGTAQPEEWEKVRKAAKKALGRAWDDQGLTAAAYPLEKRASVAANRCWRLPLRHGVAWKTGRKTMADLLRCIIGNPFRRITLHPSWLAWNDSALVKMASAIYDQRRFVDLPILADALEEAGCDNADVLAHCRSGGEHVRGCWVVDALLGKS